MPRCTPFDLEYVRRGFFMPIITVHVRRTPDGRNCLGSGSDYTLYCACKEPSQKCKRSCKTKIKGGGGRGQCLFFSMMPAGGGLRVLIFILCVCMSHNTVFTFLASPRPGARLLFEDGGVYITYLYNCIIWLERKERLCYNQCIKGWSCNAEEIKGRLCR